MLMTADSLTNCPPPASGLPASLKPLLLLVGIAAAVAAGVTVVLWSRGPTYSLLYANLAAAGPGADRAGARCRADSLPLAAGLERHRGAGRAARRCAPEARRPGPARRRRRLRRSWTRTPGFGVSQFMENARYQHALETELARTIASLQPVEGARVHLAVPRQSAFVRDHRAGERLGVRAAQAGPPPRAGAGAGHRQSRGLEHSGARRRPGHRGRPAGPAAVLARTATISSPCASSSSTWSIASRTTTRSASRRC